VRYSVDTQFHSENSFATDNTIRQRTPDSLWNTQFGNENSSLQTTQFGSENSFGADNTVRSETHSLQHTIRSLDPVESYNFSLNTHANSIPAHNLTLSLLSHNFVKHNKKSSQ
jgi:hypothetical protein